MGASRRFVGPAWRGFLLIGAGFLVFAVSYFLLPLYVTTMTCFDTCSPDQLHAPAQHGTVWEFSLNMAAHLSVSVTPVVDSLIVLLCLLPLFAAVMVVGCSIGFLANPQGMFATWSHRGWRTGITALALIFVLSLVFLSSVLRPEIGYVGMLLGYGLLWRGNRVFLVERRAVQGAPQG